MKKPDKNWLEWIIFAVSLCLVLGIAGILISQYLSLGERPPDPQMQLGAPEAHEGYFAVPITVSNRGDETIENVHLEVTLQLPGGESEKGECDLPYLPRRGTRQAWVTFRHDPREGKLESRILGYQKP